MNRLLPSLVAMFLVGACPQLLAQSILVKDLEVVAAIRPLDELLRIQLADWSAQLAAAQSADGKQTPEWWKVDQEAGPVTVHGPALLKYAKDHPKTPESLICLAYIIDMGEGEPGPLFVAASDELVTQHSSNPALSWLCSRCTNSFQYGELRSFLTRLRTESTNAVVRGAATFQLARLLDASIQMHDRITVVRDIFATSGLLKARPGFSRKLELLERMNRRELAAERDRLLTMVTDEFGDVRPWSATRMFGRLNYEFHADPAGETFQRLANGLRYEVANLRVGCIAPDFNGTLANGQPFRLRKRRGRPTLLMFSFKGCSACEGKYPSLRDVQARLSKTGFSIIGVMVDQEVNTVTAAQDSGKITWPCVWDGPSGPIADSFRVKGYPTTILLDGEGRIVATNLRRGTHLSAHITNLLRRKDRSEQNDAREPD